MSNKATTFAYYYYQFLLVVIVLAFFWIPTTTILEMNNILSIKKGIIYPYDSFIFGISLSLIFWLSDYLIHRALGEGERYMKKRLDGCFISLSIVINVLVHFIWYKQNLNKGDILTAFIFYFFSCSLFIPVILSLFKNPPTCFLKHEE